MNKLASLFLLTSVLVVQQSAFAAPKRAGSYFGVLEGGVPIISTIQCGGETFPGNLGVGLGFRWDEYGLFGKAGFDSWPAPHHDTLISPGAIIFGLGGEMMLFERRVRSTIALGPSMFSRRAAREVGNAGFFLELRPAGLIFRLDKRLSLVFDPLAISLNVPVLSEIPLVALEYVSTVGIEFDSVKTRTTRAETKEYKGSLFIGLTGHFGLPIDDPKRSAVADSLGFGLIGGWRFKNGLGLFGSLENNRWFSSELAGIQLTPGVLNVGVGAEYRYADEHLRSSLTTGLSILMMDTFLLKTGETGGFLEIRPVGFRWQPLSHIVVGVDPLLFAVVAPRMRRNGRLVLPQYRIALSLEVVP